MKPTLLSMVMPRSDGDGDLLATINLDAISEVSESHFKAEDIRILFMTIPPLPGRALIPALECSPCSSSTA